MLQKAIQAIKSGNKELGHQLLVRILETDPDNAQAWVWLSACFDDPTQRKECLEAALEADPGSQNARRGLELLQSQAIKVPIETPTSLRSRIQNSASVSKSVEPKETKPEQNNLAWICPRCNSRNMTPIVLRTQTTLQCQSCGQTYACLSGEAVWGQRGVDRAVWSEWLDWIVRLQQADGSIIEVAFTLRTSEFTIAGGDFLVVFMRGTWTRGSKVVQVENKTTGKIART